jgi:hypothetical protein
MRKDNELCGCALFLRIKININGISSSENRIKIPDSPYDLYTLWVVKLSLQEVVAQIELI